MFKNLRGSLAQKPRKHLFAVAAITCAASLATLTRIPGVVQGFGTLRRDGLIDAAVVVPTLNSEQILTFELSDLLAPRESMSAGPMSANVPGNVFVPRQTENYGIFPVTIQKPEFGYYPKDDTETELATIHLQAPFGEMISKVRAKAPYTEILGLVTFKRYGLTEKRDWSQSGRITTVLDRAPQSLGSFNWVRNAPTAREADVVVSFQETPNEQWMLGGLDTKAEQRGNVAGVEGLDGLSKILFMRVTNDADNSPTSARGYFRNHTPNTPANFQVESFPAPLEGILFEKKKTVRWTDPKVPGWVGVFRTKKLSAQNLFFYNEKTPREPDDPGRGKVNEQWVPGFAETFTLEQALKDDEVLVIVFVGSTSEDFSKVNPISLNDSHESNPILEAATELRLVRVH